MKDPIAIDRLIDWLNKTRPLNPSERLVDLLQSSFCDHGQDVGELFSAEQLVDLACIDLIQQRRAGNPADVESLIAQFPSLQSDSRVLDLIDADICVQSETNPDWDAQNQAAQYATVFPQLADQINELIGMNVDAGCFLANQSSLQSGSSSAGSAFSSIQGQMEGQSLEISIDSNHENGSQTPVPLAGPIDTPDWFLGGQVVASGQDGTGGHSHWLIRGRDAARRTAIAMKVIKLPATLHSDQADHILNACEKAAKVRNPAWVAPSVAAIQKQHLAVIRPWEFGTSWQTASDVNQVATRLKQLAMVAFALQAAHRVGAAHGCVHANNIVVRHDGSVRLVDVRSSCSGTSRWSDQGFQANSRFWHSDTQDLLKLVVADVIDLPGNWSSGLQDAVQTLADCQSNESCGAIGDELIRRSDALRSTGDTPQSARTIQPQRSWRKRLASWIDGS